MYYGVHLCLPDHSLEQIAQGHEAHPNEQQNQYLVQKNITYHVKKSKNRYSELDWLLNDIVNNKERAKKTVVFGRNIVTCANLYDHLKSHTYAPNTTVFLALSLLFTMSFNNQSNSL
jgi:superfamily II DNA/RNA helicase